MEDNDILFAFLLTFLAGLATCLGGAVIFFAKRMNTKFVCFSLGFSAGVMILVSFGEFLVQSREVLTHAMGQSKGLLVMWSCFFLGVFSIGIIDRLIPSMENPHEVQRLESLTQPLRKGKKIMKVGIMTTLGIMLHNFPEGMATLFASKENPSLGITIALAVAIHNIPEGIAVAVPVFQATKSKKKAFLMSVLSGLAEPLGAIIAYLLLMPFISPMLMGQIFALVAGIMVFISLDELLPTTQEYGEHHIAIYGLIFGMIIMALSLVFLS